MTRSLNAGSLHFVRKWDAEVKKNILRQLDGVIGHKQYIVVIAGVFDVDAEVEEVDPVVAKVLIFVNDNLVWVIHDDLSSTAE
jgi:hypothetical protein